MSGPEAAEAGGEHGPDVGRQDHQGGVLETLAGKPDAEFRAMAEA